MLLTNFDLSLIDMKTQISTSLLILSTYNPKKDSLILLL